MTLEELKEYHPNATAETWHRHANGGGWVQNTASVEDSARVFGDARVFGTAHVFDYACVSGDASGNPADTVAPEAVTENIQDPEKSEIKPERWDGLS